MLLAKNLPIRLWAEAVNTATYVLNRTLGARSENATPYELWTKTKPVLSHLRTFGYVAYALIPNALRKKWDPKSQKLILVGYNDESHNYRLYNPETGCVSVSRNVRFNKCATHEQKETGAKFLIEGEKETPDSERLEPHIADTSEQAERDHRAEVFEDTDAPNTTAPYSVRAIVDIDADTREPTAIDSSSARVDAPATETTEPTRPSYCLRAHEKLRVPNHYDACVASFSEPANYTEAINGNEFEKWKRAIEEEIDAHHKNNTWNLVPLPEGRKPVGFKWVFKIKNCDSIDRAYSNKVYRTRTCVDTKGEIA